MFLPQQNNILGTELPLTTLLNTLAQVRLLSVGIRLIINNKINNKTYFFCLGNILGHLCSFLLFW